MLLMLLLFSQPLSGTQIRLANGLGNAVAAAAADEFHSGWQTQSVACVTDAEG